MIRRFCITALGAAALLLAAQGIASAQAPAPKRECFFVQQFENWKAGPGEKSIYVSFRGKHYYRLDLAGRCSQLSWPDARLITKFRSSSICSATDWDISVNSTGGIPMPCIVKAMTPMTPAEVAALPKEQKP